MHLRACVCITACLCEEKHLHSSSTAQSSDLGQGFNARQASVLLALWSFNSVLRLIYFMCMSLLLLCMFVHLMHAAGMSDHLELESKMVVTTTQPPLQPLL